MLSMRLLHSATVLYSNSLQARVPGTLVLLQKLQLVGLQVSVYWAVVLLTFVLV